MPVFLPSAPTSGWGSTPPQGRPPEKLASTGSAQKDATVIPGNTDSTRTTPTVGEGAWAIRHDQRGLPYWWNSATGEWIYHHTYNAPPPTAAMVTTDYSQPYLPLQYQPPQPVLYTQPAVDCSAAGQHAPTHQPTWLAPPFAGTVPGTMVGTMPGTPPGVVPVVPVAPAVKSNDIGSEFEEKYNGSTESRQGGAVASTKAASRKSAATKSVSRKPVSAHVRSEFEERSDGITGIWQGAPASIQEASRTYIGGSEFEQREDGVTESWQGASAPTQAVSTAHIGSEFEERNDAITERRRGAPAASKQAASRTSFAPAETASTKAVSTRDGSKRVVSRTHIGSEFEERGDGITGRRRQEAAAAASKQAAVSRSHIGSTSGERDTRSAGRWQESFTSMKDVPRTDIGSKFEESSDGITKSWQAAPASMKAASAKTSTKRALASRATNHHVVYPAVNSNPYPWEKFYRENGRVVWIHSVTGKRSKIDPYK